MLAGIIFPPGKQMSFSERETVRLALEVKPTLTPEPTRMPTTTPTPIPTPEPSPTEIPFSVLAPTITMSAEELTYDDPYVAEEPNPPPAGTYKLVVNKYYQFITVLKKDESGKFNIPVRYMLCSTGKKNTEKTKTETPAGTYSMEGWKTKLIESEGHSARYATHLKGGIYFHSILYTDWRNVSSYTPTSYKNLGTKASHGCIRLWVPDAKWIFENIAAGTEVEIIKGGKNTEAAEIRSQLVFPKCPKH